MCYRINAGYINIEKTGDHYNIKSTADTIYTSLFLLKVLTLEIGFISIVLMIQPLFQTSSGKA